MEKLVNYGVNEKKKRTLIDNQKYELLLIQPVVKTALRTLANKNRDKRTRIKNMTEMYNNIPAPDYMKQLAKSH